MSDQLPPSRPACEFSDFFASTPPELLRKGIYSKIATPLKGGPWRDVSLLMLLEQAFGIIEAPVLKSWRSSGDVLHESYSVSRCGTTVKHVGARLSKSYTVRSMKLPWASRKTAGGASNRQRSSDEENPMNSRLRFPRSAKSPRSMHFSKANVGGPPTAAKPSLSSRMRRLLPLRQTRPILQDHPYCSQQIDCNRDSAESGSAVGSSEDSKAGRSVHWRLQQSSILTPRSKAQEEANGSRDVERLAKERV